MKKLVLILILFRWVTVFSQTNSEQPSITDSQTYGYVNGIRLDSISTLNMPSLSGAFKDCFLITGRKNRGKKQQLPI